MTDAIGTKNGKNNAESLATKETWEVHLIIAVLALIMIPPSKLLLPLKLTPTNPPTSPLTYQVLYRHCTWIILIIMIMKFATLRRNARIYLMSMMSSLSLSQEIILFKGVSLAILPLISCIGVWVAQTKKFFRIFMKTSSTMEKIDGYLNSVLREKLH